MEKQNAIKISMVIPTFTCNKEIEDMTARAISSYQDQVDEIIITEDAGFFSPTLLLASDVYLYGKENLGFTANVNRGWKAARGEYVFIVNSDTELVKGNLEDLCIPGKVTSPVYSNQDWGDQSGGLSGSFFVVPKSVSESRGILNESMRTWRSDSEYNDRVIDIFERVPTVEIYHRIEATNIAAGITRDEIRDVDNKAYERLKS